MAAGTYVTFDPNSLAEAYVQRDLCLLSAESGSLSAPGWSADSVIAVQYCASFRKCTANFQDTKDQFAAIGAEELVFTRGEPVQFELPAHWNNVDKALSEMLRVLRKQFTGVMVRSLPQNLLLIQAVFLAAVVIGLVLAIVGLAFSAIEKNVVSSRAGFVEALSRLTLIGSVTLFTAGLGFLVYDSAFLVKALNSGSDIKALIRSVNERKTLCICSLVAACFGGLAAVMIVVNGCLAILGKLSSGGFLGHLISASLFLGAAIAAGLGSNVVFTWSVTSIQLLLGQIRKVLPILFAINSEWEVKLKIGKPHPVLGWQSQLRKSAPPSGESILGMPPKPVG